jgi:uncharacterized delta-60 repeat protein
MIVKTATGHFLAVLSLLVLTTSHVFAGPGGWDQTYAATISSGPVYAMALQPNGELVVGGAFTAVDSSSSRYHLARLFSDGSLDSTFFATGSGISSTVWSLAVQTDGRIVIGGDFSSINGTARTRIARLNANGTVDGSFLPTNTINNSVLALAVQTNNSVVIGGLFTGTGFPLYNARLNADGTTDTSFSSYPNGAVYAIAIQTDGKIVIGGSFTTVNGANRYRIARLDTDGSLDNSFQNGLTGASSTVRCMQIQTDGKILIGGDFTTVNNTSRSYIARLNTDGSLDTGFANSAIGVVGANNSVYAVVEQPNNSVVIGGAFTTYSSASLSHVARLYADGTRDTTFTNFGINSTVQSLAIQSDGGILIGGQFTTINNTNWSYLGRLYGDLYPPQFVVQPASRNTNVGANVTFKAQVSNPTTTSFQWRLNGNNISGATGTSYSLFNVQLSDAGNYSVFVNDAVGGTTSSNAVLQVGIAPAFTSQASSLSVTQGQSASFSVTATGTPLNYFWKKNGTFIASQTNSSITFASVVATNAATYTCQVSNFLGSITSTGAVLTVAYPPTISVQPVGQTIGAGSNFTVSVTANGNPAVTYQWRTNGMAIIGATVSSFTVTGAQTNNSADYDVILTNSFGSVTSSVATVSVVYYPPTISQQPLGGNVVVGSNFTMNASAAGTAPFNWQWRTNGTPIPGANATSYAINPVQLKDAGSYDVVVTNNTGSVTSSVAVVNVGYVPVVVQQPPSLTNIVGGTANFSCIVTGSVPINLQWTFFGNPLTGATNATLTITNLQPGNIGYYALTATNIFGGTVSSNAALNLVGYDFFGIWNGLVAYYPFNGNANDATGNGNNGTNNGAVLTTDRFGNTNSAYYFNGAGAYLDLGVPSDLAFSNNFTLTAWCNFFGGTQNPRIMSYGSPNGYELTTDGTGSSRSFHLDCGSQDFATTTTYPQNVWHSVVAVAQNGIGYIYVDGALAGSGSISTLSYTANLQIGIKSPTESDFWGGSIDDVRFYNRALSSNEVTSLYRLEADVPVITQQPQAQTINAGGTATFSVAATAANPLTYQWHLNSTPISGATNAMLTLSNVQSADVGFYSLTVSNVLSGVASASALLNITGYADPTWSGLVAYYPFNGNANDVASTNNGTIQGVTLTADRFNNPNSAYYFNGSSWIETSQYYLLNGSKTATISAWVTLSSSLTSMAQIVSAGDYRGGYDPISLHFAVTNADVQFQDNLLGNVNSAYITSGGASGQAGLPLLTPNNWHQIIVVLSTNNPLGELSIYVDGILECTQIGADDGSQFQGIVYDTSMRFLIGAIEGRPFYSTPGQFWNGNIDDIRIYNRAFSADEVAYLYALESQSTLQPPQTLTANLGAGPNFNLNLTGLPNQSYVLQSATNLTPPIQWLPVLTNAADTNGVWQFTDTNLNSAQKFYRVTTP